MQNFGTLGDDAYKCRPMRVSPPRGCEKPPPPGGRVHTDGVSTKNQGGCLLGSLLTMAGRTQKKKLQYLYKSHRFVNLIPLLRIHSLYNLTLLPFLCRKSPATPPPRGVSGHLARARGCGGGRRRRGGWRRGPGGRRSCSTCSRGSRDPAQATASGMEGSPFSPTCGSGS